MNVLSLCCALNNTYFALQYENKTIDEIITNGEHYHSLYLISKIKETLEKNSLLLKNLDLIAVNCGPGSFTGIRVALSVAKILSSELNIPLVCLNSAEILLEAYKNDVLLMDARRDMYFIGTKDKIEIIYKNQVEEKIKDKSLLCDKNCHEIFKDSICFEEENKKLGAIMIKLALEKYEKEENKQIFDCIHAKANYIQTPPVF